MNQLLDILNEVMRIATFQWHGAATPNRHHDRSDLPSHHAQWTDRHPVRRSRS
ncbi:MULTISPECIES: hypothetical protein [unclassified Mesorhizobium]|uniref:hypothetical protein n=1 Tax=unclassified Mesorhizobium TaxID=325217 RepID=UPI00167A45C7|nr:MULTISPECIES: hypothetical protein [unclassified Mesorhizobium]